MISLCVVSWYRLHLLLNCCVSLKLQSSTAEWKELETHVGQRPAQLLRMVYTALAPATKNHPALGIGSQTLVFLFLEVLYTLRPFPLPAPLSIAIRAPRQHCVINKCCIHAAAQWWPPCLLDFHPLGSRTPRSAVSLHKRDPLLVLSFSVNTS